MRRVKPTVRSCGRLSAAAVGVFALNSITLALPVMPGPPGALVVAPMHQAAALPVQQPGQLRTQLPAPQPVAAAAPGPMTLVDLQHCGALPTPGNAQVVRIDTVLRAVICHNAGVLRGTGLASKAQSALNLAQAVGRPALSLRTGADAESRGGVGMAATLNLQWLLFDFRAGDAAAQQARHALAAVLSEQRIEVANALADAAQRYADALSAKGRMDAAASNAFVAHDSSQVIDARQSAGAATMSEKLQAQTAKSQAELDLSRAIGQWLSARGALAVAMGLPSEQAFEVQADEPAPAAAAAPDLDIAALVAEARANHPRVVSAAARLAEARARVDTTTAQRWGSVTAVANAGRSRSSSESEIRGSAGVGVQWSFPILDRGLLAGRLNDAQADVVLNRVALDDAGAQIELQVWQLAQALLAERAGLRASRTVLQSAEAALRATSERYRAGVGGFGDVLNAQNAAASARFQAADAQASLQRTELRLSITMGRLGPHLAGNGERIGLGQGLGQSPLR